MEFYPHQVKLLLTEETTSNILGRQEAKECPFFLGKSSCLPIVKHLAIVTQVDAIDKFHSILRFFVYYLYIILVLNETLKALLVSGTLREMNGAFH